VERGQSLAALADETKGTSRVPRWLERVLRTPLLLKLAVANALLLSAVTATAMVVRNQEIGTAPAIAVVGVAFLIALSVNMVLVNAALHPIAMLGTTVDSIWHGDLSARVPASLLADRDVARVGRMLNVLLDDLVDDRARTRRLAAGLINSGDRERAAISKELHDSTAQSLAALVMQLSAATRSTEEGAGEKLKQQLEGARELATATLEEVRRLAYSMHPRVLDDLGLIAALRRLARECTMHSEGVAGVRVRVIAKEGVDATIPAAAASVLYRVAEEALLNACRHAEPENIEIRVRADADSAILEVSDDGVGFDPDAAPLNRTGMGLFTMRERMALIDGDLRVTGSAGGGTSVIASVPLRSFTERATVHGE
jgi:signal transduction histidine kinase